MADAKISALPAATSLTGAEEYPVNQGGTTKKATTALAVTAAHFASPSAGGYFSGRYYDNSLHTLARVTSAQAANRIELSPFFTSVDFEVDRLGVAVSTAVASSLCKVLIYDTGSDGWPGSVVYISGDLDCSTTGAKEVTVSFTFTAGVKYWIGTWTNSTQTLRCVAGGATASLGPSTNTGTSYLNVIRRVVTYGGSAPDPFTAVFPDLAGGTPAAINMRAV